MKEKGYTLIELLIVLAIIGLLVSAALPIFRDAIRKAKETVLRENLFTTRQVLDQYKSDKGKYPESLEALVDAGYVRSMPFDPITRSDHTWQEIPEPIAEGEDPNAARGIWNVRSGASGLTLEGKAYNEL